MRRQDTCGLDRNQRAAVFSAGGLLCRVADHPLNAPRPRLPSHRGGASMGSAPAADQDRQQRQQGEPQQR